jgi:hypothetical protein
VDTCRDIFIQFSLISIQPRNSVWIFLDRLAALLGLPRAGEHKYGQGAGLKKFRLPIFERVARLLFNTLTLRSADCVLIARRHRATKRELGLAGN